MYLDPEYSKSFEQLISDYFIYINGQINNVRDNAKRNNFVLDNWRNHLWRILDRLHHIEQHLVFFMSTCSLPDRRELDISASAISELKIKTEEEKEEFETLLAKRKFELAEHEKKTSALLKRVEATLANAREAALGTYFKDAQEAQGRIAGEMIGALALVFVLVIVFLCYSINSKAPTTGLALYHELMTRSLAGIALISAMFFFARNYEHAMRLRADYEFKATSSFAYQAYKKEFSEDDLSKAEMKELTKRIIDVYGRDPMRVYSKSKEDQAATPISEALELVRKVQSAKEGN